MLAVGCLVGMLTALLGLPGAVTLVAAMGAAVGLLAFLRPGLVKTLHAGPDLQTGPAALIGHPVQVLTILAPRPDRSGQDRRRRVDRRPVRRVRRDRAR